jgi:hypothetical protein
VRLLVVPIVRAFLLDVLRDVVAFQTLRVGETALSRNGRRRCVAIRRPWVTELLHNSPTSHAPHVDAGAEECSFERRLSVDPTEAGDFADGEKVWHDAARLIEDTAVQVHKDSTHALARERKELGGVERWRIDRPRFRRHLLTERLEVHVDALLRQFVVADTVARRFSGDTPIPTAIFGARESSCTTALHRDLRIACKLVDSKRQNLAERVWFEPRVDDTRKQLGDDRTLGPFRGQHTLLCPWSALTFPFD